LHTEYQTPANDFVVAYKPLLHAKLADLKQTLTGITIIEFDVYDLFQDVRNHKEKYGLANVTDAAFNDETDTIAADVDHYLFWDSTHPTRVGHAIVAESAYKQIVSALGLSAQQSQP
jgi:phospholipase/lecithinase/hemolysin